MAKKKKIYSRAGVSDDPGRLPKTFPKVTWDIGKNNVRKGNSLQRL